jgi:hypothetical protein
MNPPLEQLRQALGEKKVRTSAVETLLYRYDAIAQGPAPVAVVLAESTQCHAAARAACLAGLCQSARA